MVVDTIKDELCVNKIIGQKSETIIVEGDMIIPDTKPDILNTINARGIPCIYKKEVLDGKIRLDGCINLYIIYLAESEHNNTRGLNFNLDFTQIMDFEKAKTSMILNECMVIKNIDCKILNGRKLNVRVTLETKLELYARENIEVVKQVNSIENVQILSNNIEVQSLLGTNNTKVYAKDSLSIDEIDEISDILNVNFQIINEDTKISYNKILAKADAYFKVMYLTIDDRISIVEGTIPVMGFIEMPDIKEHDNTNVEYELKNIIVKPNNAEEHSIYVEAEIELFCKAFENKNIDIIQDLYSLEDDLDFSFKNVQTVLNTQSFKNTYSIKEKQDWLDNENSKIYDVEVNPIITNEVILSNKIIYEGEINLKYVYIDNTSNAINTKTTKIAFNFSAEVPNMEMQSNTKTEVRITQQNFMILSGGNIDVKIDLEFLTTVIRTQELTVIDEITMQENRVIDNYSMIIYFVKPGDTLWKIAKKYKSTIEDIARVNNLENENLINVGQQLFIPRHIKRRIAV